MTPDWLDDLRDTLLPALQARGMAIDARIRLNLEAWLAAAEARGLLGGGAGSARIPVRAIVCKSAREQALFDEVFKAWLSGDVAVPGASAPGQKLGGKGGAGKARKRQVWRWRVWLLGLIALIALGVGGAWLAGVFDASKPEVPVKPTEIQPAPAPAPATAPVASQPLGEVRFVGDREVLLPGPPRLFGIHPLVYGLAVLLMGSVGLAVRRTRRQQLARISTREKLREQHVFARQLLPVAGERRHALRQSARLLRRLRPAEGRTLDLLASTAATAARAGLFSPVWRPRQAMPEYLVLVDRASHGDQQAHWAAELARDLHAEGVSLSLYEYDRDPRWVAPLRLQRSAVTPATRRSRPLRDLVSRHRGQGLVLIGDGHALIDLHRGGLAAWVQAAFAPWPRRVLMTPLPMASWGPTEDVLAGADLPADAPSFLLVPARIDALAAAARWLTAPAVPEVAPLPGAPAILPALLVQAPGRWLSREAPPAAEVMALVDALRDYLGPTAYTWLVASAAYPQLSADLTAYLAHRLAEQPGLQPERPDPRLFEARLMAIAQLPWCRQGWMPDWLRRALLLSQPVGSRIFIKSIVQGLFKTAGNEALPGGIALGNVARDDRSNWLRRLRDRIGLAGVVEGEPADSPLRDVIYLGVLRGDYDRELTLEVGDTLDDSDLAPLTLNPLRWLWAGAMVVAHPARRVAARLQRPGPPAAVPTESVPPPDDAPGPDIYLLYAQPDAPIAERLARHCRARGWRLFTDVQLMGGRNWIEDNAQALEAARLVVVLWSSHSVTSQFVLDAAMRGWNREVLIPVRIEAVAIPAPFDRLHTLDVEDWSGAQDHRVHALLDALAPRLAPRGEVYQ